MTLFGTGIAPGEFQDEVGETFQSFLRQNDSIQVFIKKFLSLWQL